MKNVTSPSGSLLVMKVTEDLHRFTDIDYFGSTTGWTCVKSVLFSSQRKRSSYTVQTGSGHIPHPMNVTDFISGMKQPERKTNQLHLASGLRICEINLRFPVPLHGLIAHCK